MIRQILFRLYVCATNSPNFSSIQYYIYKFTNLVQSGIILVEPVETTGYPSVDHIKWKISLNNPPTSFSLPTKHIS